MKASLFTLFATFSAILLVTTSSRAGCSCAEVSPCEAFGSASAVFVGRMLGGSEKVSEYTKYGQTFSVEAGQSRFAVEESFKGVAATEITVFLMDMKGTSCAGMAALVRGQRYLVYAGYLDSVGLAVGPCSPTKRVETAKADLEFLRTLREPGTGGRIYGQVAVETGAREPTPLADVTVIVEDEAHSQLQVKTDRTGNFEFNGLRPGKYLVNPVLPENYVFRDEHQKNRTVQVFDRGCARAPFWINVNGRIGGRVSDSSGRPAPVYVKLESVDQRQRTFLDHADDAGAFQIQGIPPGQYLLRIDMKKDGKESAYFYPGTSDRAKATLIDVSIGQKIEGFPITLGASSSRCTRHCNLLRRQSRRECRSETHT